MTRWLDIALEDVGTSEIAGASSHNQTIVDYFRVAGRPDITNDETAWCAAFAHACLARAEIEVDVPAEKKLLAREFEHVGTPIDTPRRGAIAIFSRGNSSWSGHVAFVLGQTATHLIVIGGNQSNAVTIAHYPKSKLLALRWPEQPKTADQITHQGSRTQVAARQQKRDIAKAAGAEATKPIVDQNNDVWFDVTTLPGELSAINGVVHQLADFALFVGEKWWLIATGLAIYWGGRAIWNAARIRLYRTEDQNNGKLVMDEVAT